MRWNPRRTGYLPRQNQCARTKALECFANSNRHASFCVDFGASRWRWERTQVGTAGACFGTRHLIISYNVPQLGSYTYVGDSADDVKSEPNIASSCSFTCIWCTIWATTASTAATITPAMSTDAMTAEPPVLEATTCHSNAATGACDYNEAGGGCCYHVWKDLHDENCTQNTHHGQ